MRTATGVWLALALCLTAEHVCADSGKLVDPTRPAAANLGHGDASRSAALCVQAVVTREGTSIAIVNGHLVRAGDRLADIAVKEVTPGGVRYRQGGHEGFARFVQAKLDLRDPRVNNKAP